eukprot:COSAG04_NODE_16584_length_494_cov_1.308861_1_plen_126_part_10
MPGGVRIEGIGVKDGDFAAQLASRLIEFARAQIKPRGEPDDVDTVPEPETDDTIETEAGTSERLSESAPAPQPEPEPEPQAQVDQPADASTEAHRETRHKFGKVVAVQRDVFKFSGITPSSVTMLM